MKKINDFVTALLNWKFGFLPTITLMLVSCAGWLLFAFWTFDRPYVVWPVSVAVFVWLFWCGEIRKP